MSESVTITTKNAIGVVTLNRPEAFNAFDLQMGERFATQLVALGSERGIRGIVICGAGKAFCAGGDLKWALSVQGGTAAA
ncbi:MAG TPA: enoyl-CoA hydratase/isomerase family protein, partial [Burkholderiales bacterium]|nr:enoyl-CoA hydratase/isomerase family protein [Burkholderiales bacterium]